MADVVNLNRFRKGRKRVEDERQAEENRLRFGRTKAEKNNDAAAAERLRRDLDGKKVD